MINLQKAICHLNPNVAVIRGDIAYDEQGNEVAYDKQAVEVEAKKIACKETAKALLAQTDWSVLPDVGLANQDEFVFYRLNLRNLIKNPSVDAVFEDIPTAIWS